MNLFLKAPAPVPNGIDPSFFNVVSQYAHFGTMFSIAITFAIAMGWKGLVIASIGEVAYAGWHEFWYDPRNENSATRGSDIEDFCFLLLGAVMAWIVWATGHYFGRLA